MGRAIAANLYRQFQNSGVGLCLYVALALILSAVSLKRLRLLPLCLLGNYTNQQLLVGLRDLLF